MTNPWLNIPFSDYENHMSEVGQTLILNNLIRDALQDYKPACFVLVGCTTGNGLEHVNNEITTTVYAIDINREYLDELNTRFSGTISDLRLVCQSIESLSLMAVNADLVLCALVLEYVNPENALKAMFNMLSVKGKLALIVQRSNGSSFVTKTKYHSLERLSSIAAEVDEASLVKLCHQQGYEIIESRVIHINALKSFVYLVFENVKIR
ncbi:class I SAM-dependent methyltransferase [Alkaliflexus imshenetskii]|uniref:class I SAM-dependent methyltransferase n=1 Tax=Alkaliflexus imshenetskii TaxID=286730 RepID=UPI0006949493|nr:class I SAM-dependent methyltransferase [Alkaliflexus imshenetskii]